MLPIPAIGAVLALRGAASFMALVHAHSQASCPRNFDELLLGIPAALPVLFQLAIDAAGKLKRDPSPLTAEQVFFVGWSDAQQRIIGRSFCQETLAEGFLVEDIETVIIAPWDESQATIPDPSTPILMEALIRAQVRLLHGKAPDAAAGGRLILCEITKDSMTISRGAELG